MRCVQLGCGYSPIDGWVNYDYNKFIFLARIPLVRDLFFKASWLPEGYKKFMRKVISHQIRFANAAQKIPEADNSVDILYSSHMLEHLDRDETQVFLKELMRVLKPGGGVRIVVPDFDCLIQQYAESNNPMLFLDESCLVGAKPKTSIKKLQYLIQGHGWHFCMYNRHSLGQLFEQADFCNVKVIAPGETRFNLPSHLDLNVHSKVSLYLEAEKPI